MATPTSLPATFVAGNVLTAAQMNALRGAFRMLQVVNATYSTAETTSSNTFSATSLSASITPSDSANKVLIFADIPFSSLRPPSGNNSGIGQYEITKGGTQILQSNSIWQNGATSTNIRLVSHVTLVYLDSPATTSATTYGIGHRQQNGTLTTFPLDNFSNTTTGTLVLMEVSA